MSPRRVYTEPSEATLGAWVALGTVVGLAILVLILYFAWYAPNHQPSTNVTVTVPPQQPAPTQPPSGGAGPSPIQPVQPQPTPQPAPQPAPPPAQPQGGGNQGNGSGGSGTGGSP